MIIFLGADFSDAKIKGSFSSGVFISGKFIYILSFSMTFCCLLFISLFQDSKIKSFIFFRYSSCKIFNLSAFPFDILL
jgi:hypothetical protein